MKIHNSNFKKLTYFFLNTPVKIKKNCSLSMTKTASLHTQSDIHTEHTKKPAVKTIKLISQCTGMMTFIIGRFILELIKLDLKTARLYEWHWCSTRYIDLLMDGVLAKLLLTSHHECQVSRVPCQMSNLICLWYSFL